MKRWLLAFALLLLVPSVHAASPQGTSVDQETDTVTQAETTSIHVSELIEFHVADAGTASGNWSFQLQPGRSNLQAFASKNGQEESITPNVTSDGSGHDTVYVNISTLQSGASSGDRFAIRLEYDVGTTYDHVVTSKPSSLVVYAEPLASYAPLAQNIPNFITTGERYHSTSSNPQDGLRYSVQFQPAPTDTPGARNLNVYLWALGGIVVGFLLAALLARRGTFGQRIKKFEKGGQMESRDVLEARRRTLMAALKELELAHDAKEIPDAAYAPLKEEYKAQTVRVMRSLEDKKEPGS